MDRPAPLSLQQRCAAVELLVVDVDGVLTAGGIVYADDGAELKTFPVRDGRVLAAAVADACPEVRAEAHYVTRAGGGRGAVREVIELILRCQGAWQKVVAQLREARLD